VDGGELIGSGKQGEDMSESCDEEIRDIKLLTHNLKKNSRNGSIRSEGKTLNKIVRFLTKKEESIPC
jgi:hypothetical protein